MHAAVNQAKATQFAKFVSQKLLKQVVKQGTGDVAEALAAIQIQNACIKEHKKIGVWPDRDAVAAAYFAKLS